MSHHDQMSHQKAPSAASDGGERVSFTVRSISFLLSTSDFLSGADVSYKRVLYTRTDA